MSFDIEKKNIEEDESDVCAIRVQVYLLVERQVGISYNEKLQMTREVSCLFYSRHY